MLLSFLAGAALMSGGLAAVAPPPPGPTAAVAIGSERAKPFSAEVRRMVDGLGGDPLRRLETAGLLAQPAMMATAVESEILALSDRVLAAPERIRRLLDQEGEILAAQLREAPRGTREAVLAAHARRADRLMADLQPILDRRLDGLLAAADALRLVREGATEPQLRAKVVALVAAARQHGGAPSEADASVLADLERRFAAYFDPVLQ